MYLHGKYGSLNLQYLIIYYQCSGYGDIFQKVMLRPFELYANRMVKKSNEYQGIHSACEKLEAKEKRLW